MPKKVVISGYYGFDNFGDDAILSVLCDKLKALHADITVISSNPNKNSTTSNESICKSVKDAFKFKSLISNFSFISLTI